MQNASTQRSTKQELKFLPDVYDANGEPLFIRHPDNFPIDIKRNWRDVLRPRRAEPRQIGLGLCFESSRYMKPGTVIELSIPLRGETQTFHAHVALVMQNDRGYEIGCFMESEEEAYRARIVEQICHIEAYLQSRRQKRGLSSENRGAQQWIDQNAAAFPA